MKDVREERRVVTALFADLVGSTSLAERLDPEEVKLIVGEAIARAIVSVEHYGGVIKDLAGDGVLALFGAPVAHEDDPERAIRAGWEIVTGTQVYAEEVRRGWGIEGFAIRVGIHTGEAVLGQVGAGGHVEYGAFGDSVNTAARLQAAAQPGVVLVSDVTQKVVAPLFEWADALSLTLKGKSGVMLAYPLKGVSAAGEKVRGLATAMPSLVGREPEREVARTALSELATGRGSVLFVVGDAGIGKSRMIAELLNLAGQARSSFLWLRGRCVSYGESLPYWPYRALIRDWLQLGEDDPELKVRVALRRQIERLFPGRVLEIYPYLAAMLGLNVEADAGARIRQLSPESLQFRTFEVVQELVTRLSADRPVVIVIDDLHWADSTSVQLTEKLVGLLESVAVLLVVGHRPERDHASWALKEKAARDFPHLFAELNLRALGNGADTQLLRALVGESTLPPAFEERICSYADGNPFYIEEIVRSLIDRGELVREGGSWRLEKNVDVHIPNTVEGVILARIDRLAPESHSVVTAAAVLGRSFTLSLLEAVVEQSNGQLDESLHELQRLELIREQRRMPEPEYRFKHALIQEAAYRTLVSARRKVLHQRAAAWLENKHRQHLEEVYGLLAHHWHAAEEDAKAIDYLRLAGDKARDENALDEAIGHYRELVPLLERADRRAEASETLFKLSLALHTAMRYQEAAAIYDRAFQSWTPPPLGDPATATLKMATTFVPNDSDPTSAIAWANIQLCMQLGDRLTEAWPNRNIVPSLAQRWEVTPDGLRYVFHLRDGLTWNDGAPLTAADIVNGIRRVLNPDAPGSSVSIYFVLENALEYYRREHSDMERIGVHVLDDRTVEFRLVAPAPYFMNVMNRPDGGPQRDPRDPRCGPFKVESSAPDRVVLVRDPGYQGIRSGNVLRVEFENATMEEAVAKFRRNEVDLVPIRFSPGEHDVATVEEGAEIGAASWSQFLTFNHKHPQGANLELRRALAAAIDREALARHLPVNLVIATGGIVPPAVQGHTPDIAVRFDPDQARDHFERSGFEGVLEVAATSGASMQGDFMLPPVFESWREVFGKRFEPRVWTLDKPLSTSRPFSVETPLAVLGWLPGYPDPEYYLRLLLHTDALSNKGEWSYAPYDSLIERARHERTGSARLALFHEADRMAVQDQCALIPLTYGRAMSYVKPWVHGWWEWGKSCASFADLRIDATSPRLESP